MEQQNCSNNPNIPEENSPLEPGDSSINQALEASDDSLILNDTAEIQGLEAIDPSEEVIASYEESHRSHDESNPTDDLNVASSATAGSDSRLEAVTQTFRKFVQIYREQMADLQLMSSVKHKDPDKEKQPDDATHFLAILKQNLLDKITVEQKMQRVQEENRALNVKLDNNERHLQEVYEEMRGNNNSLQEIRTEMFVLLSVKNDLEIKAQEQREENKSLIERLQTTSEMEAHYKTEICALEYQMKFLNEKVCSLNEKEKRISMLESNVEEQKKTIIKKDLIILDLERSLQQSLAEKNFILDEAVNCTDLLEKTRKNLDNMKINRASLSDSSSIGERHFENFPTEETGRIYKSIGTQTSHEADDNDSFPSQTGESVATKKRKKKKNGDAVAQPPKKQKADQWCSIM